MSKLQQPAPGRLLTNNVILEAHEYATINVLLASGEDVELLVKSRTPHSKSADICMHGMTWEMKSPDGKTLRSIERIIHRATQQSRNVIIDLRRTKVTDKSSIPLLEKVFSELRSIRILWIITKQAEIIKLKK